MADLKISQLNSIVTVVPATDVLPVVQGGTTLKITPKQILESGSPAVLASATITGDLTVDTSTLKVDSTNNRVGIGTASPTAALDVQGSSLRLQLQSSSNGAYSTWKYIGKNSSGTAVNFEQGLNIAADNAFELYDNQNTQLVSRYISGVSGYHSWFLGGITGLTLNSTANLVLKGGTAGATGVGLTFPATQVASSDANCLDDYEEGTFTPTVGGTATYTTQSGRYTKIGNRVYVNMRLEILLIGTGSSFLISGLPFTSGGTSNISSASVGYFGSLAISANYIAGYIASGGSTVRMTGTTAASANITNGIAVIGNATDIAFSFFYEV